MLSILITLANIIRLVSTIVLANIVYAVYRTVAPRQGGGYGIPPSPPPPPPPKPPEQPPPPPPPPSPPPAPPSLEVHLSLSKNYLNEDPNDYINATLSWSNLPQARCYTFGIVERSSNALVDWIDVPEAYAQYIPSSGSMQFHITYLMNRVGQNYLPAPDDWRGLISICGDGTAYSLEPNYVSIYDKFSLNDITAVSYDYNTDKVSITLNKSVDNALLLYQFFTYDRYGNLIRSSGLSPYWHPIWFSGNSLSIDLFGDPRRAETKLEFNVLKRGTRSFVININRPPIPVEITISDATGSVIKVWIFENKIVPRRGWIYYFPDFYTLPQTKSYNLSGDTEYISIGIDPPGTYTITVKRTDTGWTQTFTVTFTGASDENSYRIDIP